MKLDDSIQSDIRLSRSSILLYPNYTVFLCLKIVSSLANSADHDEMPQYVASHLGLHCLCMHTLEKEMYM